MFTLAFKIFNYLGSCSNDMWIYDDWYTQLHGLVEASKTYQTLQDVIDHDVARDTVKTSGSYSRNLRRVRQGLDLVRAIFEQLLSTR